MARRAIPMIAFPRVRTLCHLRDREYALKRHPGAGGLGQLMGVARNRTRARALQTRPIAYVDTGTNS